jgi:hypothetical protein
MSCVLMARWTEDLTLDLDPGEMLWGLWSVVAHGTSQLRDKGLLFLEHFDYYD